VLRLDQNKPRMILASFRIFVKLPFKVAVVPYDKHIVVFDSVLEQTLIIVVNVAGHISIYITDDDNAFRKGNADRRPIDILICDEFLR